MVLYKVSYKQGHSCYEDLFLERDIAFSFYESLKRSKDIVSYAHLSSITLLTQAYDELYITGFGV